VLLIVLNGKRPPPLKKSFSLGEFGQKKEEGQRGHKGGVAE
jgi:hypothetical protein